MEPLIRSREAYELLKNDKKAREMFDNLYKSMGYNVIPLPDEDDKKKNQETTSSETGGTSFEKPEELSQI